MRLIFESNADTARFVIKDESASRAVLFETFHLDADERLALSALIRQVQDTAWTAGYAQAARNLKGYAEGMLA